MKLKKRKRLLYFEILLQLLTLGAVHDDGAALKNHNTCGNVDGVLQVVRTDKQGGSCTLMIVCQHMLEDVLT